MEIAKTSDMIYTYESMKAAYEAGEARVIWSEISSGREPEPPSFEDFMKQEYNDPNKIQYEFRIRQGFDDDYQYFGIDAYDIEEAHDVLRSSLGGIELKQLTHIELKIVR